MCWRAIIKIKNKKKKQKKNMSLNVIISEVCRDLFLFVVINAYDSKVSRKKKIIIMIIIIIKEASSRFGREFDELIICSASRACSYLFNLDLIWILCFCQLKCFSTLPGHHCVVFYRLRLAFANPK